MIPATAPLWRPALCLAQDPEQAARCVEPPCTEGKVRCPLCAEGMGPHADILEQMGFDEDQGARTSQTSLLRDLKRSQERPPATGYMATPPALKDALARALDELRERKLIQDGPRHMLILTPAGREAVRRINAQRRAELDSAFDEAMARDAREGDDALGDFAADAARERRVFGTCPLRRS